VTKGPWELPADWEWATVGDVCVRDTGRRDPRSNGDEPFTYIEIAGIDRDRKSIASYQELRGAGAPSRARKIIRSGDVLVATTRPNLNAVAVVPPELDQQVCSTGFCVLRPNDHVLGRLLFAYVRSPWFVQSLSAMVSGALYPAVTDLQVFEQSFPRPPLPVQRRIVAKIDAVMAKMEETGVLCQQAASEVQSLLPSRMTEIFADLAHSFNAVCLGDLLDEARYGTSVRCSTVRQPGARPVLRVPNILSGAVSLDDLKHAALPDDHFQRVALEEGDLLLVRTNGNPDLVGRCAVVPALREPMAFASYLIRLRCNSAKVRPAYLQHALKHLRMSGALLSYARTSAGQFNLSVGRLREVSLPLPPLGKQDEVVAEADSLEAKVQELGNWHYQVRADLDRLAASVLDHAFRGHL